MLCDICKNNEATIRYKHIVNGVIKDYEVCKNCYSKQNKAEYTFAKISTKLSEKSNNSTVCDFCGRSFSDIMKTAYVGCNHCYITFKSELTEVINKYHNIKK